MDLFDLGAEYKAKITALRAANAYKLQKPRVAREENLDDSALCSLTLPDKPYEEQGDDSQSAASRDQFTSSTTVQMTPSYPPQDLISGLKPLANTPTLVLGVASDILFPAWQQREIAETLIKAGNQTVRHVELGEEKSLFGHDTFLLDLEGVGGEVGAFLG